ncbi:MAG: RnfH family protein [Burkholderiales bacterium]|nr:RnfH family protein [Burkholderiales bacterium]MDE2395452.1 RnfH family protein [Burkholderiales bacterium]MDE2456820.1 RnfH family protein [Burkholderiales bacterium]
MGPAEELQVEVVYCPRPGLADLVELRLAAGATLADALRESGLLERHGLDARNLVCGIWFRKQDMGTPLRDRDRVEVYRALKVDPKEARRLRYRRSRER